MAIDKSLALRKDIEDVNEIPGIHKLLNVISCSSNMRFVAIARVTEERWITAVSKDDIEFGLRPGDELAVESTICNEIRQHHIPVVIEDVDHNTIFCNHHTPKQYGFKSYISYPIFLKDGSFFGTLCAIDPKPAKINNDGVRDMFKLYTDLISYHLESIHKLRQANRKIKKQDEIAELRETFVAILGHDLRNPVGTTRICADMLLSSKIPEAAKKQAEIIKSTSYRMQSLIDNLLDFANGNIGEGISLNLSEDNNKLEKELGEVITECKIINEDRLIESEISLHQKVDCDTTRMAQLLSNLLNNAIKHSISKKPVLVKISSSSSQFSLSVINHGETIPKKNQRELFKPYFKSKAKNNENGLGLGLYIASEIAKAHHGNLGVTSEDGVTSFNFSMPVESSLESTGTLLG
tara:strand:- start:1877 stop:3100 length:1224 start_codon:yes stop_codon:yes gene_type:complete